MLETLLFSVRAIAPIVLLVALGYGLRRIGFFTEDFLRIGNKLVFHLCLPVMVFQNMYQLESLGDINWTVVIFTFFAITVLFGIGLCVVRLWVPDRRQKGVVLQAIFRSNFAVVGLPLAEALGGANGIALASLMMAIVIPTFNILAVIALSLFVGGENTDQVSVKQVIKNIAKNPLILSILLALGCLALRSVLPRNESGALVFSLEGTLPACYKAITYLANAATPLALLVLGGKFTFQAIKGMKREIFLGTVWRVALSPLVGFALAILTDKLLPGVYFGASEYAVFTSVFATPVAVSSSVMAEEMGNDEQLAGQIVVWTSVLSMFTLFCIIFTLRSLQFV